jgi:hypothetical protein
MFTVEIVLQKPARNCLGRFGVAMRYSVDQSDAIGDVLIANVRRIHGNIAKPHVHC